MNKQFLVFTLLMVGGVSQLNAVTTAMKIEDVVNTHIANPVPAFLTDRENTIIERYSIHPNAKPELNALVAEAFEEGKRHGITSMTKGALHIVKLGNDYMQEKSNSKQ